MATTKWGRKETMIWPPHSPIYTYGAVFMAIVLTGLFLYCRFSFGNNSLQRFYTPIYIRSSVAGAIGATRRDNYRMLMVRAREIGFAARLHSPLPGTGAKLYRCSLKFLPQKCGLRRRYSFRPLRVTPA